jgi:hypothetical protein
MIAFVTPSAFAFSAAQKMAVQSGAGGTAGAGSGDGGFMNGGEEKMSPQFNQADSGSAMGQNAAEDTGQGQDGDESDAMEFEGTPSASGEPAGGESGGGGSGGRMVREGDGWVFKRM